MSNAYYPNLLTRIKALMMDAVILIVFAYLLSIFFDKWTVVPDHWRQSSLLILFLYDPILTHFAGGTLGHRALGLRVKLIEEPTKNIFFHRALLRTILKTLLGWISLITVTSNPQKRGLHDLFSGSVVIYKQ